MSVSSSLRNELENFFNKHRFQEFKWIDPKEIVVSHWVRMKCEFGCEDYGGASCPPNLPSVSECEELFQEYTDAWIFRFTKTGASPEELDSWSAQIKKHLLDLERDVFLQGYVKVFLLSIGICSVCSDCVNNKADCRQKELARPTPEGMAVDVFSTVSKVGYPIKVLMDKLEEINRYAILLVQ
jgi:predicted metal-binding protein